MGKLLRPVRLKLPTRPLPLLYPSASDFQFPSAGDRWFRAYGAYMRNFSNELIYII